MSAVPGQLALQKSGAQCQSWIECCLCRYGGCRRRSAVPRYLFQPLASEQIWQLETAIVISSSVNTEPVECSFVNKVWQISPVGNWPRRSRE